MDGKMDRYQRVEKPRAETPINENEIRITTQGRIRNYITYATSLLQEKGSNEIVLKAMGRAINKAIVIVELIKRRISGLHQIISIGSTDITDTWEPLEEGLLPLETTRHVSVISITLSKKELDASVVGYQPPLPKDQVKPLAEFDYEGEDSPTGQGRGRGGRGSGRARGKYDENGTTDYNDGSWDNNGRGYGRGGYARGRGLGFRGRGRGGYGGRPDYQPENNGYDDEVPVAVRGRGKNNPLYLQSFTEADDALKLHHIVHCSLDVIDERVNNPKRSVLTLNETFLGLLFPTESYKVFGYLTNTKVKFIMVTTDLDVKDADVRSFFRRFHAAYVDAVSNPFHVPGKKIASRIFAGRVSGIVKTFALGTNG
ncbi:unnamed protein product [Musa hybrid cultivar]